MIFFFLTLLVVFTLASSLFSLSQIALFSLSTGELRLYTQSPDARKQMVARLVSKPRDLLVTLLFCDIAANILVQNTAANIFGEYSSWLLKVGVPLLVTLLLGEILPKTLALPFNAPIAYHVAPIIQLFQKLLAPVRWLTTSIATYLSRLVFFFLKKEENLSKEELTVLLKSSEHHGLLTKEEAQLVQGYLSLSQVSVKERMRPRDEIIFFSLSEPLPTLEALFVNQECSRIPICQGELQNILGILSAQEFFLHQNTIKEGKDLVPLLKRPYYVPETIPARTLLRHFFNKKEEMGIVVDEYSSVVGIITEEDLYEIVVGDITDRRDIKLHYTPAGKDVIITSGKFELVEFEELFQTKLPSGNNMVTVGGWLTEQLGEIPKSGTKFVWGKFLFQILAADPNRIRRIYIRRLKDE